MNKSENILYYSTVLAAAVLCALCLALPIIQWTAIEASSTVKACTGLAAFAIGICKLVFFPLGSRAASQKRTVPALLLTLAGTAALFISVTSTRELLSSIEKNTVHTGFSSSLIYQEKIKTLNALNADINNTERLRELDTQNTYRERATKQGARLDNLRTEKRALLAELETTPNTQQQAHQSIFGSAPGIGVGQYAASVSAPLFAALILHITCILALCAVTVWWQPIPTQPRALNEPQPTPPPVKTQQTQTTQTSKPKPDKTAAANNAQLTREQVELAKRIISGEFGNTFKVRELIAQKTAGGQRAIRGGHAKLSPVLAWLEKNNDLLQTGSGSNSRYELTQKTIETQREPTP